jgi:hypothetical protein
MPARKPALDPIPHYAAVNLAPDSPLKQEVIDHAQRIMAVRMHMLELMLKVNDAALVRANDYMLQLLSKPQTPPEGPVRRDPNAVSMAQVNRTLTLGMKILDDMARLREAAYREAREAAYRRTGQRVGPRFWLVDEDQAPAPVQPVTLTSPWARPQPAPEPMPEPMPEPTTETAPQEVQAQVAQIIAAESSSAPLTKRLIRLGQERMDRHGLPRRAQVDLARMARQQRWSLEKFNAEVDAALAATA